MLKKLLTLALMFAFLAPFALPTAQATPAENSPSITAEQKKPKPTPTPRPRKPGPQGSDDE